MKSLTIKPNATLHLVFESADQRDKVMENLAAVLPRETHSRFKSSDSSEGPALTIRIQDITRPVTIGLDGTPAPAAPEFATGGMTNPFARLPEGSVPGVNAELGTHNAPKTSGVNLTEGVPGAINNDPSTATNAGIEGSPAQAIASAVGNGPAGPTPGGFQGPDKAADISGAAPGTHLPRVTAGSEKEKPDEGAVNIQQKAEKEAADGEAAKKEAKAAKTPKVSQPAPSEAKASPEVAKPTETAKPEPSKEKSVDAINQAPL